MYTLHLFPEDLSLLLAKYIPVKCLGTHNNGNWFRLGLILKLKQSDEVLW